MATHTDAVVVGPGNIWSINRAASLVTVTPEASPAATTSTFALQAADAAKLKVGDMLISGSSPAFTVAEASTAPIITAISDDANPVITVSPAFGSAPSSVSLLYRDLGSTDGGITVAGQVTTEDQMVDQEIDAVATTATGREITITAPLAEATLENFALGLGVAGPSVSGSLTIGSFEGVREDRVLVKAKAPGGAVRWMYAPRAVNRGTVSQTSAKNAKTLYNVEFKLYLDATVTPAVTLATKDV